jgi:hypothetical protein
MTDFTPIPVLSAEEWDAAMKTPMTELWRQQSKAFAERMLSPEFRRELVEAWAKAETLLDDEIGFGKYP